MELSAVLGLLIVGGISVAVLIFLLLFLLFR